MKSYRVMPSAALDPGEGALLEDFRFPWTDAACPRTGFRAVWNAEALAFRFEVEDADIVLDPSPDRDAAVLGSDRVELFFAQDAELRAPYYGAEMDPRGWVYDYRAEFHRRFDDGWSFPGLRLRGEPRPGGYAVEGAVPLEALRVLGCLKGAEMVAGVYRAEFSHGPEGVEEDWISWIDPGTAAPDFHVPASFGRFVLEGAEG